MYKSTSSSIQNSLMSASDLIAEADALVITSGAGIDSGLPDFRGENGFWNAYPALGSLGINFTQIANPKAFQQHPELAWGFYGHRLQLYRNTIPHEGFLCLLKLADQMLLGLRHFTSNVDGQLEFYNKSILIAKYLNYRPLKSRSRLIERLFYYIANQISSFILRIT